MNRVIYKVSGETIYIAYIVDSRQDLQKLVDTLVLMVCQATIRRSAARRTLPSRSRKVPVGSAIGEHLDQSFPRGA